MLALVACGVAALVAAGWHAGTVRVSEYTEEAIARVRVAAPTSSVTPQVEENKVARRSSPVVVGPTHSASVPIADHEAGVARGYVEFGELIFYPEPHLGTIVDADGRTVEAELRMHADSMAVVEGRRQRWNWQRAGLAPGEYRFSINTLGVDQTFAIRPHETALVTSRVGELAEVSVTTLDVLSGEPTRVERVMACRPDDPGKWISAQRVAETQWYLIAPPGPLELMCLKRGYPAQSAHVVNSAGWNEHVLEVDPDQEFFEVDLQFVFEGRVVPIDMDFMASLSFQLDGKPVEPEGYGLAPQEVTLAGPARTVTATNYHEFVSALPEGSASGRLFLRTGGTYALGEFELEGLRGGPAVFAVEQRGLKTRHTVALFE